MFFSVSLMQEVVHPTEIQWASTSHVNCCQWMTLPLPMKMEAVLRMSYMRCACFSHSPSAKCLKTGSPGNDWKYWKYWQTSASHPPDSIQTTRYYFASRPSIFSQTSSSHSFFTCQTLSLLRDDFQTMHLEKKNHISFWVKSISKTCMKTLAPSVLL